MRTRDAARILRTEGDPEKLANAIFKMGITTYIKATEFNKRAGLAWMQRDGESTKKILKQVRFK